jgi:hypothetical protein
MRKDIVFGVTVETQGKFLSWGGSGKGQMNIFQVFFCFLRVAAGTVHIERSFSKMDVRIGL